MRVLSLVAAPWAALLLMLLPCPVDGQGGEGEDRPGSRGPSPRHLELPQPPSSLPPVFAVEAHASFVVPVSRVSLCPRAAECVFHGGFGVGGRVERRWASGLGLGLGYELWLLDSGAVYEIGVAQSVLLMGRYTLFDSHRLHPSLGLAAGPMIFGDTFGVATLGVNFIVSAGLEIELTEAISISLGVPWHVFLTGPFTTPADGVARAEEGANTAFALHVGLLVLDLE
ncbi:MAG: hypothetical protein KC416_00075 [Myxococcales bacterium]|nr:hypothetical protein [Myxococcales bacterium]